MSAPPRFGICARFKGFRTCRSADKTQIFSTVFPEPWRGYRYFSILQRGPKSRCIATTTAGRVPSCRNAHAAHQLGGIVSHNQEAGGERTRDDQMPRSILEFLLATNVGRRIPASR